MKPLLTFDVSAPFTIIRVPVALEIISRKFTEHINQIGIDYILENTCFMPKDKVISVQIIKFFLKHFKTEKEISPSGRTFLFWK